MTAPLTIKIVGPQRKRHWLEPWEGRSLAELAAQFLPPDGGYSAVLDADLIEPADWAATVPAEGQTVMFVPDFGFLPALLTWLLPSIFSTAMMGTAILGPITWGMVFNTIGYLGASYLINSLMPKPKLPEPITGGSPAHSWNPHTTQQ